MVNHEGSSAKASRMLTLVATILVIAVMYAAREVLIPMALAILLAFLLGPLVYRVERLGIGRTLAVLVVTTLSFIVIGLVGWVVFQEVLSLADSLPKYKDNIREKARALGQPGVFSRAIENARDVTEEAIKATTQPETAPDESAGTMPADAEERSPAPPRAPVGPATQPIPVEVRPAPLNPFEQVGHLVQPILQPLGQAGLVIILLIFMLIQREDLRDRVIALTGPTQINTATQVLDDAASRLGRYLLMQFIVNATYGIPIAIGLWWFGVPNPVLWGALCFVLRYIPYAGPWIAASMPIILSLATSDNWTTPLMVIGLFLVVELISNNVVEPVLYGSGTGLSPMAVIVSAIFWTWLWGIPGLVLATPLTACLVVMGRHLPHMKWLAVLLGDEPGLPLPARVYQRLLAMGHEDVVDMAEEFLQDHTLVEWYDQVLLPALLMAEEDRYAGALDAERSESAHDSVRTLVEELGDRAQKAAKAAASQAPGSQEKPLLLVVPARDEADGLAAIMLGQLLRLEGQNVQVLAAGGLTGELSEQALKHRPGAICVSAMPPMAVTHARYMCKRLDERLPDARLIVGLWNDRDLQRASARITAGGADAVVGSLAAAVDKLRM